MFKKILILMLALMPVIAKAQQATGEWYSYPTYAGVASKIIDTPDKVYFVSGINLFSREKSEEGELYSYTKRNLLNDISVKDIYYNYTKKYLLVVYKNCNIDLIFDSGKVVNLSDISDAVMMGEKEKQVNDVAFYGDRIYVATSFGLVVFDDKKFNVVESGVYNVEIPVVTVHKNKVYIFAQGKLLSSSVNASHYVYSSFTPVRDCYFTALISNGDNDPYVYAISTSGSTKYIKRLLIEDNNVTNWDESTVSGLTPAKMWNGVDGIYMVDANTTKYGKISNGTLTTKSLPSTLKGSTLSSHADFNKVWTSSKGEGISYLDISESTPTVIYSPFTPDAGVVEKVGFITTSNDGSRIYVSDKSITHGFASLSSQSLGVSDESRVNLIKDNKLTDLSVVDCTQFDFVPGPITGLRRNTGFTGIIGSCQLAPAPAEWSDDDVYYVGCSSEGIYKVVNGEAVGVFNTLNSSLRPHLGSSTTWGGIKAIAMGFDRDNNFWTLLGGDQDNWGSISIHTLPAAAAAKPFDQITKSDWNNITNTHLPEAAVFWRDSRFLGCRQSDAALFLSGYYATKLLAYNIKTNEHAEWTNFVDQDGKIFNLTCCFAMNEDKDGKIWIGGYNTGIVEISNPMALTNPSSQSSQTNVARRLKVPRTDGSGYADYLLDTEVVLDITTDNANRKWIATQNSGVYVVSPAGDEILEHYTVDNSYLPSNQVNAICADPNSNKIYMGTLFGLTVFNSSAAPAADDYSNVYAYPNPVRPEYTGWITVNGLMDNSLVRVADAMGNTLSTGLSNGGMYMWDGRDHNGNRVKSGVYYVYASQKTDSGQLGEAGNKGKVAAKILVVN